MFSLKYLLKTLSFILVITIAVYFAIDIIQDKQNIMSFEDYDPPSSLVVEGKEIKKAKYPFIVFPVIGGECQQWTLNISEMDG